MPKGDALGIGDIDADDMALLAQQDSGAAARLLDRHGDRLMAVAWRLLGDSSAAEDIVQDVFLTLLQKPHAWQPGAAKFSTWLYRVTVNRCYDRMRKASSRLEKGGAVFETVSMTRASDERLVEDVMMADERVATIRDAMETLPERQRVAMTLCYLQGLSNKDAAEIMEIGVSAFESLVARGRRQLKENKTLQALMASKGSDK